MRRQWRGILFLLMGVAAMVCVACSSPEERSTVEAGGFKIIRTQHSSSNWNTGGTSTYFTVDVRYRKAAFQFPVQSSYRGDPGQTTPFDSTRIAAAYLVSRDPAALLVVAGDPNNHASWNLLVDTPNGLRSEHVASHSVGRALAWLDGDTPIPIDAAYSLLALEGGRWLWVDNQSLIDLSTLHVHRLEALDHSMDGAAFVAFSPDRTKMARFDTITDANDFRVWHAVILENDIASGTVRSFPIDKRTMWFDTSLDIDQAWLQSYFHWRSIPGAGYALQRLENAKPRSYHGRLQRSSGSQAIQYEVPRLGFEHRQAVMDFLASALGGKYVLKETEPHDGQPAAATATDAASTPRTDAAIPPSIGPLSWANVEIADKQLTIYFSERGLSIENQDVALNDVVRRVATTLDAAFASANGQQWLVDAPLEP